MSFVPGRRFTPLSFVWFAKRQDFEVASDGERSMTAYYPVKCERFEERGQTGWISR
jgi:hypothetical protein